MMGLMAAVAQAQADILRLVHNMCGALEIQNVIHMLIRQHRLLYKHAAQFRLCGEKQVFYKILLHIHVLII